MSDELQEAAIYLLGGKFVRYNVSRPIEAAERYLQERPEAGSVCVMFPVNAGVNARRYRFCIANGRVVSQSKATRGREEEKRAEHRLRREEARKKEEARQSSLPKYFKEVKVNTEAMRSLANNLAAVADAIVMASVEIWRAADQAKDEINAQKELADRIKQAEEILAKMREAR